MNKRILIVDDEEQVVFVLRSSLKKLGDGYEIVTARMDSLKAEHFDLVIAGLHDSDQDNLDLVRQVRRIRPQARTMVIAGQASPGNEGQARQLMTVCLSGPLDLAKFTASVQHILS